MKKIRLGLIGESQSATMAGVDAYILEKDISDPNMMTIHKAVYKSLDTLLKNVSDDTVVELQVTDLSPVTNEAINYFNEHNIDYCAMIG